MTSQPLMTHEIGSLAKPSWRVKAIRGSSIEEEDLAEAIRWGKILEIPEAEELLALLSKNSPFSPEDKQRLIRFSSLYALRLLEKAGLDLVWDGEQQRIEMYEHPIKHLDGFVFHGHVRSFDNKYYLKASCEAPPHCRTPYHLEEYLDIKKNALRPIKIPITGAYTLVDWSYDAFYGKELAPGIKDLKERQQKVRSRFLKDMARSVIYPNLKGLYDAGARYLQIDEPAAAAKQGETGLLTASIKESIGDLAGKAFFSMHICFSEYQRLFPELLKLEGIVNEIHLEYANRDSRLLGITPKERIGYEILNSLKSSSFQIGLGVIDIHTDYIEPPELVRDRILYACEVIGDPKRILPAPDCGLRTRTWDVAFEKLKRLVEGRNLALDCLR